MFVVKRLGRNGMWNAVSLIDENGSFRGEAKFETMEEADEYLEIYMKRMKDRLRGTNASELRVKVFDDSQSEPAVVEPKEAKKPKKKHTQKKKPRK